MAVQSEVLVIGSGIAGLTCALECATYGPVAIVTKDRLPESSSQYAQGGIASVWSPKDSFESHTEDTLVAGAGLCHRDVVETVVREGPTASATWSPSARADVRGPATRRTSVRPRP